MIYRGEINALIHERPWVATGECEELLRRASYAIPANQLDLYVNAEGRYDLELMHSHEPDRGLAGI